MWGPLHHSKVFQTLHTERNAHKQRFLVHFSIHTLWSPCQQIHVLLVRDCAWVFILSDTLRSLHPYANPEVLSFLVEDGSPPYMKWMDEAIPDDWRPAEGEAGLCVGVGLSEEAEPCMQARCGRAREALWSSPFDFSVWRSFWTTDRHCLMDWQVTLCIL